MQIEPGEPRTGHRGFDAVPALGASQSVRTARDPRIDALRGLALLMIFVDHIPGNYLSRITVRNFGFSDAAEIFVLLAEFSSMLAYGKVFERDGMLTGLRRLAPRLGRLYLFQIGLLLTTIAIALMWTTYYELQPSILRPIREAPVEGMAHALTLRAVPTYLDILPLYIVLLAAFPLIYVGLRKMPTATLAGSAAIWLVANFVDGVNMPNWMDGQGWFFNPFAWQFLFAIGAALAMASSAHGGGLPRFPWLAWLSGAYLMFAFLESAPWSMWGLPNPQPLGLPSPDKSGLGVLRILDILALAYLVLSSSRLRALAGHAWMQIVRLCGRHSLEVFAIGCIAALFGRLLFKSHGDGIELQIAINTFGLAAMFLSAWWLHTRSTLISWANKSMPVSAGSRSAIAP